MSLRDYQIRAADAIESAWQTHQSTLCVMPTGTGKTVLFAEILRRRAPGRALVIAHREELIMQARDQIERFAGLDCEIEMAELTASANLFTAQPVVIATVQTLVSGRTTRRMARFNPADFTTLVIDEFHHAPAASYRTVLDHFLRHPQARLLGVTATPDRADAEALGQVCQSVAFEYAVRDAITDGWLVSVGQQRVTIDGLDFSAVHTTAGDLNGAELAAVMESEKNLHGLCSATLEIIGRRQTIVFTASVRHAEMACHIFNRHRAGLAEWVCGATEKEARRRTMSNVLHGRTQILCNVGVATEGFDAPGVEVIVMGRPTKSRALFAQMAGRATRPLPGVVDGPATAEARRAAIAASAKPACLLVDFVGNSGRHKLVTALDILGGEYPDEIKERAGKIMEREGGAWPIDSALECAEGELRAEREAREARRRAAERAEAERLRELEEARKQKVIAKATFVARPVNPFDAFDIQPVLDRREGAARALSEKQRLLLQRQGIDPDSMSPADARRVLTEQFRRWDLGLCSVKQAALLKRYGFETADLSRDAAKRLIDRIAANRWRLPADLRPAPAPARAEFVNREDDL